MRTLSFADLGLTTDIQRAVGDQGFEEPTPIQSLAIPLLRDGKDVIGQAHTGTGKTAAYGIPIIEAVKPGEKKPQALVICPTRELAIQVSEELRKLAKYRKGIVILPVYGGQPIERQLHALRSGVQVVIATPGRLLDHLDRRSIDLSAVRTVVLDEADEMLDMGFRDDIEAILKKIPGQRQTVLFSATMSKEIRDLSARYLNDPRTVQVMHDRLSVPKIEQSYFEVRESGKIDVLSRLLDLHDPKLTLVFANTKRRVDEVVNHLQARGYLAEGLHGDMNQAQRERVMAKFREGRIDILVATDVAARGIDVPDVDLVVNFDVPQDPEYYIHRIGRTGRAGKSGTSFTFVSGREMWKLRDIQRFAKIRIAQQAVPAAHEITLRKAEILTGRVRRMIEEQDLAPATARVQQMMGDEYTSLEVASALLLLLSGDGPKPDK
ncbi:MAG TPA: DEAD/DEAH box helicase [Methanoregulaceae archaeon]|nr:MAG: DEAD/DEAH box helicase [Methanolinea sp.]HON82350.1 DEAD/DEAH box helicase [Methanoregulaceae archaeon]HPD09738.1 DEAD/DEAH box helicase [Methanoregulaceae archaeon]HRT14541.1 DEAD/DEAH box helicase [Methanoregulaceae archaeon]HRU30112.1 DEAD/DEAH box helicase [Methanoregulaceae archaeon]